MVYKKNNVSNKKKNIYQLYTLIPIKIQKKFAYQCIECQDYTFVTKIKDRRNWYYDFDKQICLFDENKTKMK